jgi:hypothetical protein
MTFTPTALTSSSNSGPLDVLLISAVLRQEGGFDLVAPALSPSVTTCCVLATEKSYERTDKNWDNRVRFPLVVETVGAERTAVIRG